MSTFWDHVGCSADTCRWCKSCFTRVRINSKRCLLILSYMSVSHTVRLSVRLSSYPHVSAPLPLYGFSWNLIFGTFTKICLETPALFEIGQNIGHSTWRLKYFYILSKAGWYVLLLNKRAQGTHYCLSMATLGSLMFLNLHVYQQYEENTLLRFQCKNSWANSVTIQGAYKFSEDFVPFVSITHSERNIWSRTVFTSHHFQRHYQNCESASTPQSGTSHKTCLWGFGGNGSIAWTSAVSHVGRTSNAFKVTMKLQTLLFQMVVTSCISDQYLWKYGFAI
jgi:hypothetical protein